MASLLDSPQSNSSIQSLLASKSTTQIAKDSAVKENKTAIVNATVLSVKPTTLGVGEVAKVTEKGKTVYYVGTATGGVSKAVSKVSDAVSQVNKQVATAEKIQRTALESSQKIEIAEVKQELTKQGLSKKAINTIVNAEKAANTIETKQVAGLLSTAGLQYVNRDATNAFVASETKAPPLQSLLDYSDTIIAPVIQANIKSANDEVAKFQMIYGLTEPYFKTDSRNITGIGSGAIHAAIDGGDKLVWDATTNSYKQSETLAAFNNKQEGLMAGEAMSKWSARAINMITDIGTTIGQQANVVDVDGKKVVYSGETGARDPYGNQKTLVDTGTTDNAGNKIWTQESRADTKYTKVGMTRFYLEDANGKFTYAGVADTSSQRIKKENSLGQIAGMALSIAATAWGVPFIANNIIGPLMGLAEGAATSSALAMGVSGALVGGAMAGVTGQNILAGAALGGIGFAAYTVLSKAATAAGGWLELANKVAGGDMSFITSAIADAKPIADAAIAGAGGAEGVIAETVKATDELAQAGVNVADLPASVGGATTPGIDFSTAPAGSGIDWNAIPPGGPGINLNYGQTGQLASDLITSGLPAGLISPTPPPPSSLDILNNTQWANVGNQPPSLLDKGADLIKGAASKVVDFAKENPIETAIAAAGVVPPIVQALNPPEPPKDPIYTGGDLIPDPKYVNPPVPTQIDPNMYLPGGLIGANAPTAGGNWNQYYTNLFKRQGVGAGNYLGYDLMNRLGDIPPELMGLLGTGATSGQTAGV